MPPQPRHDRHDVVHDVLAERLHGLHIVAHALHAAVAELDEVFIAHFPGHPVAHVHEPVKDAVELLTVRGQRRAEHLIAFSARGAVGAAGVFHQHRARQLFAPEGEEHTRHELSIFADKLVLLDHVVHDLRRHTPSLQLHAAQQNRRERLLELCPKRAVEHGGGILQIQVFDLRTDLVVVVLLGQIKRVDGVDRVAHIRQRLCRIILRLEREIFRARFEDLLDAPCAAYALDHVPESGGHLLARHAPVGELGYFHACSFPRSAAKNCFLRCKNKKCAISTPLRDNRKRCTKTSCTGVCGFSQCSTHAWSFMPSYNRAADSSRTVCACTAAQQYKRPGCRCIRGAA